MYPYTQLSFSFFTQSEMPVKGMVSLTEVESSTLS